MKKFDVAVFTEDFNQKGKWNKRGRFDSFGDAMTFVNGLYEDAWANNHGLNVTIKYRGEEQPNEDQQ